MNRIAFITAPIIAALVAASFYAMYTRTADAQFDPDLSWHEQVEFWKERIEKKGGASAYQKFSRSVGELSYDSRHAKAHAFGSALFSIEGASGITVCDAQFSFGCFHQSLGDAIASLGLESIPSLNDKCFEKLTSSPLSCQHGIGHGALAAIGYEDASLLQALSVCKELPGADPIGGCYGGVFMEYNMRTMLAEEATTREYKGNPFAPCDALDDVFLPACIYWQPQWWMQSSLKGESLETTYKKMGDYCRTFGKTAELARSCFEGIGNVVAQSADFDPIVARTVCSAAGGGKQKLMCLSIAANHFGIDATLEAAREVCAELSGNEREYCLAYARNEANVANMLPL